MRDFGGRGGRSSCGESRWCIISGSVGAGADRRRVQRVVAVFALAVSVLRVRQMGDGGDVVDDVCWSCVLLHSGGRKSRRGGCGGCHGAI